ncbi:hypothetical protein [Bacillus cereus group sp. BfR-BA-01317]|uniref:hypothetical protein n=1 Tax=Bacillus cereus group sp. BfR-BA-01317 TaxID=2920294 RepID=UPI001F598D35|nr:hypothetical protein [Bacillus cereus group sp. BfR-BA-01317]
MNVLITGIIIFICGFVSWLIFLLNKNGHEYKGHLFMSLGVILIVIGSYSYMMQTRQDVIQEERLTNVAEELNLSKNEINIVYETNNIGRVSFTKGNHVVHFVVHFIGESSVIVRLKSEVNLDNYCWL